MTEINLKSLTLWFETILLSAELVGLLPSPLSGLMLLISKLQSNTVLLQQVKL